MATITIVDYGMGNLRSVSKALEHLGHVAEITSDPDTVEQAERLILPGVGAFGDAMAELERRGLIEPVKRFAATGRPLLGVCLGMQLAMDNSEESPGVAGLGLIPGTVRRFETKLKVPHMGWNTVRQVQPAPLFRDLPDEAYFYFVHSYYVAPDDPEAAAGMTHYAIDFASVLWRDNIVATQFHPEKSQRDGLAMLTNFCAM
jgi:glutamine amidotransferase